MEITYSSIKPYILEETFENATARCKFQVEDEIYEASAGLRVSAENRGAHNIKNMARNTIIGRLRTIMTQVIRKVTGGGLVGNIASMAAQETVRQNVSSSSYSAADKEKAVVAAFKTIMHNLYLDEATKTWRIAKQFSDFERALKSNPLKKSYDKKTLARMLVELARADGQMSDKERKFIDTYLSAETGTLVDLMRQPALSAVELEEVTKEGKENVFMVAAALTLVDHELHSNEQDRLINYGVFMGLNEMKIEELIHKAQSYTIETIIRENRNLTREELYDLADKIGMSRDEAERAQVRYNKRVY